MKINEMIESVMRWHIGMRNGKRTSIDIINALKELQWYREQDLVKREDALYMFRDSGFAIARIRDIPKAEYRGEDNDN